MKYLIFKGENIVFSTDDKQKALDEFSKMEKPKDDRQSTRMELYERIATKQIKNYVKKNCDL